MNAFTKRQQTQQAPVPAVEERQPSEYFINIGFTVTNGETERFVNIPVVITADNIDKGIELVRKSCGTNAPDEWKQFTEQRILLGEDIKDLFSQLEAGTQIVNKDIPEDNELAYLRDLEVQFVHRNLNKETVVVNKDDKKALRASFGRK